MHKKYPICRVLCSQKFIGHEEEQECKAQEKEKMVKRDEEHVRELFGGKLHDF